MAGTLFHSLTGRTVLVIGAGLAGLSAAADLRKAGAHVTVCEARDRVGGRVWTVRQGLGGLHAEAGADFIDESHSELRLLADELQLSLKPILRDGFSFARGSTPGNVVSEGHGHSVWKRLSSKLEPWIRAFSLGENRWDGAVARTMAGISVAQWLDSVRADDTLRAMVTGLRGFFLADPEDLSLLPLVEELASDVPGQGGMYRVAGGNDRLPMALAAILGEHVRLQTEAVAIHDHGSRVRVTVRTSAGAESRLDADFVVVAVPATTLARIVIDPPLPAPQRRAIEELPYGRATKALLAFEPAFWRRLGAPRAYGTNLPIGAVWDGSEDQRQDAAVLVLLAGGHASTQLRHLMHEGPAAVLPWLDWLGPGDRRLRGSVHVSWEDDMWAGGGYAYFSPRYDSELRPWLARPHGRIVFAGEHTSLRWQGYMNGAVETGRRAAAEVGALALRERRGGGATLDVR